MELLLGCGNNKAKQVVLEEQKEWKSLVTLDEDPNTNPDYCFDLSTLAYGNHLPFATNSFHEIHAYNVLEHTGVQGDYKGFFKEFTEYHRILRPQGLFFIIVPNYKSEWALGDPGHTRVLSPGVWSFLNQEMYEKDVGRTTRTDYRHLWKGNFKVIHFEENNNNHDIVILQKEELNASKQIQDGVCP